MIFELILALVSLWLLVNSFKKTFKEKRPIDFFDYFIQRYFDYYIIILPVFGFKRGYGVKDRSDFILRFFDYFIIIFHDFLFILLLFYFFWFNRGYSVNDRLDFVLTVTKRDYNTNDQLKFILSFIRQDNDLNKWLEHVKNGRKENRK